MALGVIDMLTKVKTPISRRVKLILCFIFLMPAVVIIVWITFSTKATYVYKFNQLTKVNYDTSQLSVGVTLDQPKELTRVSTKTPNYTSYQYSRRVEGKSKTVAGIIVTSAKLPEADLNGESKIVKDALSRTVASDTNPLVSTGLLMLLKVWLPIGTTAHITGSQPLRNPYIRDNAWVFSLSISSSDDSVASPMKGDFLYTLGKNGEYITLLYDYSWDRNSAVWQKVIDSYQIDQ